jgi:hypothetical protein
LCALALVAVVVQSAPTEVSMLEDTKSLGEAQAPAAAAAAPVCTSGEGIKDCNKGYFKNGNNCCKCKETCGSGQFFSAPCTADADATCAACTTCDAATHLQKSACAAGSSGQAGKNAVCEARPNDWVVKYKTGEACKCENGKDVGSAAKSSANGGDFTFQVKDCPANGACANKGTAGTIDNPCDNMSSCASKGALTVLSTPISGTFQLGGTVKVTPDITGGTDGWCLQSLCLSSATAKAKYTWEADSDAKKKKGWLNKSGGVCPHTFSDLTLTKVDGDFAAC